MNTLCFVVNVNILCFVVNVNILCFIVNVNILCFVVNVNILCFKGLKLFYLSSEQGLNIVKRAAKI